MTLSGLSGYVGHIAKSKLYDVFCLFIS